MAKTNSKRVAGADPELIGEIFEVDDLVINGRESIDGTRHYYINPRCSGKGVKNVPMYKGEVLHIVTTPGIHQRKRVHCSSLLEEVARAMGWTIPAEKKMFDTDSNQSDNL